MTSLLMGTRRALLGAPGLRLLARDEFTDSDTTLLADHVADSGHTWSKHPTSEAGDLSIDNNRLHNTNATELHLSYLSLSPPTPDYDVIGDLVLKSDNNISEFGIAGRFDVTAATMYLVRYLTTTNTWQLLSVVNASGSVLGSLAATLTVDQVYRMRLSMRGSRIAAYVDGAMFADVVNTAITAVGKAGVRVGNAATSTTGLNLDRMEVRG